MISTLTEIDGSSASVDSVAVRYKRRYTAIASSKSDREPQIRVSPLCPKVGQIDPYDPAARITKVSIKQFGSSDTAYIIETESSTEYEEHENPLRRPAEYEWFSEEIEAYTSRDRKGKYILNSAGDLVTFPYESTRWVASVSKNMARPPRWLLGFNNAINKSSVLVDGLRIKRETLICKGLRIGRVQKATIGKRKISYRVVTFQLHHNPEGWKLKHPQAGFNRMILRQWEKRDPDYGYIIRDQNGVPITQERWSKEPIRFEDGSLPNEAQPLDRKGRWIRDPKPNELLSIKIDKYPLKNFRLLPLT